MFTVYPARGEHDRVNYRRFISPVYPARGEHIVGGLLAAKHRGLSPLSRGTL